MTSTTTAAETTSMASPAADPDTMLSAALAGLMSGTKRQSVRRSRNIESLALSIVSPPAWPGTGQISTVSDAIPMVVIPDLPPGAYTSLVGPMAAYALAELAARHPMMIPQLGTTKWIRVAILVTATRAGAWAALNAVPEVAPTVSSRVIRWSETLKTIVVRPLAEGDGSEVWRYFLASCLVIRPAHLEVVAALVGLAPLQFLLGAALHVQAGEVYAMQMVEEAIEDELKRTLSPQAYAYLAMGERATWDTLSAAAIGGYRASVTRALCMDALFVAEAYTRLSGTGYLKRANRYVALADAHPESVRGITVPKHDHLHADPMADAGSPSYQPADDDAVSVADTEAMAEPVALEELSQASTPRAPMPPGMTAAEAEEIREAVRRVPAPVEVPPSLLGGVVQDDEVIF